MVVEKFLLLSSNTSWRGICGFLGVCEYSRGIYSLIEDFKSDLLYDWFYLKSFRMLSIMVGEKFWLVTQL